MAVPSDLYVEGIHNRFSYFATWLPNTPLAIGDVGFQEGKYFKRMTSLKELGISFDVRRGDQPIEFFHTSQSGVSVTAKAEGELVKDSSIPLAKAGAVISFRKEGAFLFHALNCIVEEIENKHSLGKTLIAEFSQKKWEFNWAVVDTIVKAGATTILVSNSQEAKLELVSTVPLEATNLTKIDVGLNIHSQKGDITRFIASEGLVPMFKLARLKQSLLSQLLDKPLRFGGKLPESAVKSVSGEVLEEVELNEAINHE